MKVNEILRDCRAFHSIAQEQTVERALQMMLAYSVSALLVKTKDGLHGIFTERDLVRCHILFPDKAINQIPVKDVMTSQLLVADPEDTIDEAMGMMIQAKIRHLPVISNGQIDGMLCLEDLVKKHVGHLNQELHYLKDYISDLQDATTD
jgi:signal-transduction protein with cAMP-binding, CBS, and nucleotidyltransferase domain